MCRDCGCEIANKLARGTTPPTSLSLSLPMIRLEPQTLMPPQTSRHISLEQAVLEKNDLLAQENRKWFQKNNVRVLNLISSPGSGKTYLLEKTAEALKDKIAMSILAGDQEKDYDAQRLTAKGARVKQLNTLSSCHLDASMIHHEIQKFIDPQTQLLIIENVGNLVCPAAFDLGENEKIALLSTTEGEDKPSKYPLLFHEASLIIITKMDLVPYLDWNLDKCLQHIRKVNSHAPILQLSAKTGVGLSDWFSFLQKGSL
ncbi:MAG TPA: hydrogenase nickel incorporation protein HypB [Pseudobdellovibrionaceae bacterium]|nr:hydrogenase nickel incorporation protein HypB [Pseudobdellovibrionaceae bacterium]